MRLLTNPMPSGQPDAATAAVSLAWLQEQIDLMDITSDAKRVGQPIQRNNKR